MANSADPDQLLTDLDLHICKGRIYPGSAGLGLMFIITFDTDNKIKLSKCVDILRLWSSVL